MSRLRLLLPGVAIVGDLDDDRGPVVEALADLYAYPDPIPGGGWVRANMVTTLDGSATGGDGLSGTIGGAADKLVFDALRGLADVVLVGAGTVRAEGYHRPAAQPAFADRRARSGQAPAPALAVVTGSGNLGTAAALFSDAGQEAGQDVGQGVGQGAGQGAAAGAAAYIVTCADADLDGLRDRIGAERVIVAGEHDVDPDLAVVQLAARGLRRILLEGGPHLLGRTVAAGRLDELCLTVSPRMVAAGGPRIAVGGPADLSLRIAHLVECEGVLLGRWLVVPARA